MGLEGVVAKRVDSRYRPSIRSRDWIKKKHFQRRNFALLGWLPPVEWRGDRGCVVLGLQGDDGIVVAGVVESGYGRDLVEQLPRLSRQELRFARPRFVLGRGEAGSGGRSAVPRVESRGWTSSRDAGALCLRTVSFPSDRTTLDRGKCRRWMNLGVEASC
jgi:bifunctional non-homologous end joining protein LigD